MSANEWECVLPSGKFARMRTIKIGDLFASEFGANIPKLLARVVTVDGETLTASQFEEMDLDEGAPLVMEVANRLSKVSHKGVA